MGLQPLSLGGEHWLHRSASFSPFTLVEAQCNVSGVPNSTNEGDMPETAPSGMLAASEKEEEHWNSAYRRGLRSGQRSLLWSCSPPGSTPHPHLHATPPSRRAMDAAHFPSQGTDGWLGQEGFRRNAPRARSVWHSATIAGMLVRKANEMVGECEHTCQSWKDPLLATVWRRSS